MSPGEAIALISVVVLLTLGAVLLRQYRRRSSGRSLSQTGVKVWDKSDRWNHWR